MVKIRLRRVGAKKQPSYRVVVTDSHSPRDGRFIETIGHYNPRTDPPTVEIDAARALYWLSVGAQPSEAVKRMLDKMGVMAQATAIRKGDVSIDEVVAKAQAAQEKPEAKKVQEPPKPEPVPPAAIEEILDLDDEDVDEEDFEDFEDLDFSEPDGDEDDDVYDDDDDDDDDIDDDSEDDD